MDFMTDLPLCEGYNSIMVVVDKFTKMAHFIPCTGTITSEQTAKLYFDRVMRHHGLPKIIITDRGRQFDCDFWVNLWKSVDAKAVMSTAYHPETDGQSERVNSIVNQYLRVYTSYMQDDWVDKLVTAEFAYNNSVHTATGVSPFMANTGMNPGTLLAEPTTLADNTPELVRKMAELNEFLRQSLEIAAENMKRHEDVNRRPSPKYKEGDKVLLSTLNIETQRPKAKWAHKRLGPFTVIKEVYPESDAYAIELPQDYGIHNVFHVSLLSPYHENNDTLFPDREQVPPPPVVVRGKQQYHVEKIIAWRPYFSKRQFLVKYTGYENPTDQRWLHEGNLTSCKKLIRDYLATNPKPTKEPSKRWLAANPDAHSLPITSDTSSDEGDSDDTARLRTQQKRTVQNPQNKNSQPKPKKSKKR